MERIKFDPKELEPVGYTSGSSYSPPMPVFGYPITRKENFELMLKGETPLWLPQSSEIYLFMPECVPDNWARGLVSATRPVDREKDFGGIDMFGVEWEYVPAVNGSMVRPGKPFVADLDHWEDYVQIPDFDAWDWEGCYEASKEKLTEGRMIKVSVLSGLFERLISFIDMTDAMVSLVDEDAQPAVHRLFDKLCEVYDKLFEKFETYFHPDFVWFHDDWGSQRAPFFSANTVREMIAPYLKRIVDSAHKHGMYFELHSCGQVESLVPVMIECGVDLWNGQDMNDKVKMAQMYGDKIIVDSHPEYLSADATEEEAAANIQKYLDKFAGLRTYANRMGGHPKDNELIYALSRQMLNP
ncbi:MAG: methyltransferase [Ruminococcaceae bacterium]|nr:methyltransferase [Oscillospiraceae bacterium]